MFDFTVSPPAAAPRGAAATPSSPVPSRGNASFAHAFAALSAAIDGQIADDSAIVGEAPGDLGEGEPLRDNEIDALALVAAATQAAMVPARPAAAPSAEIAAGADDATADTDRDADAAADAAGAVSAASRDAGVAMVATAAAWPAAAAAAAATPAPLAGVQPERNGGSAETTRQQTRGASDAQLVIDAPVPQAGTIRAAAGGRGESPSIDDAASAARVTDGVAQETQAFGRALEQRLQHAAPQGAGEMSDEAARGRHARGRDTQDLRAAAAIAAARHMAAPGAAAPQAPAPAGAAAELAERAGGRTATVSRFGAGAGTTADLAPSVLAMAATADAPSPLLGTHDGLLRQPPQVTALSATASGVSLAAPLESASGTLPSETAGQIVQALRMQFAREGGEAHIRLDPRQFGDLTIRVKVDHGQVTARIESDAPVVREWLQSNQSLLRQSLAGQQLTLERLDVSAPAQTDGRAPEDTARDDTPRDRQHSKRRRPVSDERFEIVV